MATVCSLGRHHMPFARVLKATWNLSRCDAVGVMDDPLYRRIGDIHAVVQAYSCTGSGEMAERTPARAVTIKLSPNGLSTGVGGWRVWPRAAGFATSVNKMGLRGCIDDI